MFAVEQSLSAVLIVPTLNPDCRWSEWLTAYNKQTCKFDVDCLVIDSGSGIDFIDFTIAAGCKVVSIDKNEFNHGGTRQFGVELSGNAEFVVFCTQDAIFSHEDALKNLLSCFANEQVGAVYGRQLPHKDAGYIGAHARLFNYPPQSCLKGSENIPEMGIKTAFISNSFAAYRVSVLKSIGGFPTNTIMNEDTYVAAKMILAGWKIAYCAEASVFHSHDYSVREDLKRYFDIGVFHSREPWLRELFGDAEGEGIRFVLSEAKYLFKHAIWLLPSAFVRTVAKYAGYKLGGIEGRLPQQLKRKLSMHSRYWS